MKTKLLILICIFFTFSVQASNMVEQRYIDQLSKGGNVSVKQAAQSIYNTGLKATNVLDVAAEVLLQKYPNASSGDIDTLAWVCNALGQSENARYYNTLKEIIDSNAHRKLRKYAKKALKRLPKSSAGGYAKGTVNLAKLRNAKTKKTRIHPNQTTKADLSLVVTGMSMMEVYDLIGTPTATTHQQTGKAWNPFNYAGSDVVRTIAIYKNKGRVVFSNTSRFSGGLVVLEVVIDPMESGYP